MVVGCMAFPPLVRVAAPQCASVPAQLLSEVAEVSQVAYHSIE